MAPPVGDFYRSVPRPWYKVLFEQSVEATAEMRKWAVENYAGIYEFSLSYNRGLEFQALGTGKGEGLLRVRELLGGVMLTIGAGDYENDESLIRSADIGYAVQRRAGGKAGRGQNNRGKRRACHSAHNI